jgi:hypothetical protein
MTAVKRRLSREEDLELDRIIFQSIWCVENVPVRECKWAKLTALVMVQTT